MGFIEAVLALVGLVALIGAIVRSVQGSPARSHLAEADIAAPYREGLYAANRMQKVASDLEAQIYAEAASHLQPDVSPGGAERR